MIGADRDQPRREPMAIVLSRSTFGRRTCVEIEPPSVDHPSRSFPEPEQAEAFAAELASVTGWKVIDRREASA